MKNTPCSAADPTDLSYPSNRSDATLDKKAAPGYPFACCTTYWPSLRKLIIGLVNEGLVPQLFAEGAYNERLEVISDVPKGKVVWWFDRTDMKRAKETVGKVACLRAMCRWISCAPAPLKRSKPTAGTSSRRGGRDGGFILSTGAGIQGSRKENVKAMIEFCKAYGN